MIVLFLVFGKKFFNYVIAIHRNVTHNYIRSANAYTQTHMYKHAYACHVDWTISRAHNRLFALPEASPSFVLDDLTHTPPAPLLPSSFYPVSQYMGGNMAACLLTWAKQWRIHGPQSVICPLDEVELRLHNALSSFFSIPAFFLVFTFSLFIGSLFVDSLSYAICF